MPFIRGEKGKAKTEALKYGKVKVGNETVQLLPPFLEKSSFQTEVLIGMMDGNEVDMAVILQNPVFGIMNREISEAIKKYPGRFFGTIQADPYGESSITDIKKYYSSRQCILKFEMSEEWGWTGRYPGLKLNGPECVKFWELADELNLRVIIDPGPVYNKGYQIEEIREIATNFPRVKFLIEHLGYYTADLAGNTNAHERWHRMIGLAKEKNVFLGFSAIFALMEEDYPCPESLRLLKEAKSVAGAEKILWGSDIPVTLSKYTYRQMKDLIGRDSAGFLSPAEREQILGLNSLAFLED